MLHPIQDVASFLEPISGTALACRVLVPVLLVFRRAHVIGGLLQTLDGLLQARIGNRSGASAISALAGLPVGLLALLPLLSLLSLLSLLALLAGLVGIAALQL